MSWWNHWKWEICHWEAHLFPLLLFLLIMPLSVGCQIEVLSAVSISIIKSLFSNKFLRISNDTLSHLQHSGSISISQEAWLDVDRLKDLKCKWDIRTALDLSHSWYDKRINPEIIQSLDHNKYLIQISSELSIFPLWKFIFNGLLMLNIVNSWWINDRGEV